MLIVNCRRSADWVTSDLVRVADQLDVSAPELSRVQVLKPTADLGESGDFRLLVDVLLAVLLLEEGLRVRERSQSTRTSESTGERMSLRTRTSWEMSQRKSQRTSLRTRTSWEMILRTSQRTRVKEQVGEQVRE